MLCFLYTICLAAALGIFGHLVERALPSAAPRRWIWCLTFALSMTVPAFYRARHSWHVPASLAQGDPSWWARIGTYDAILMKAWLAASILLLVWGLVNAGRVGWLVRRSQRDVANPDMVDGVRVVVTPSLGPGTVGFFRSKVVIPRWVLAMPHAQRQYVLRHEDEHRRAHDAHLVLLASLALVVVPWNAALWWQLRRLSLAVELDCDNRVVAALGNANGYGEMLLNVAQSQSRGPRLQPALLGRGMLERRLTMLLAPAQLSRVMQWLLPAVGIALLYLALSMPHPLITSESAPHHQQ
jgi:beta-lactamase regulating signal transducer with metallopeptidase domain